MATLRRRLGAAVVTALKAGDTLINSLLAGTGSTLNVEFSEVENVSADPGLVGHCLVAPDIVRRVPFDEGEMRAFKRRAYRYRMIFRLPDDAGTLQKGLDLMQALERIFASSRTFFTSYVTDSEANLSAKAGRLELDEDFREVHEKDGVTVEVGLTISVTHKAALTD